MKSKFIKVILCLLMVTFSIYGHALSAETIQATKVKQAPVIDGSGDDEVWKNAKAYTVHDKRADVEITIKAVFNNDSIFFLVGYPDSKNDNLHKPWVWDKDMKAYIIGSQREDTFTFKWNMEGKEVNLSNFSDDDYTADVWYWKAHRTNPVGYSDDKHHVLASTPGKKAKELTSDSGKKRYLMRKGDEGKSSQKKRILTSYKGDIQNQYIQRVPEGSRADIKTKGVWKEGSWTIEFGRKLNTGHSDDIQFNPAEGRKYLFGVSIAGLYGETIDKTKAHYYGQGRISEKLYLLFE